MKKIILFALALTLVFTCSSLYAQEDEETQEQLPFIDSIEGDCEYRASQDADWVAAKKGQKVETGGALCTGFDSKVVVRFPGNSTLEASSLTEVEISTFFETKKQLETRLKVTVGSVRVRVVRGEIQSDFEVSTPHTTTSVKGTDWEVITSFYGDIIKVYDNIIKAVNKYDRESDIEENKETDDKLQTDAQIERKRRVEPVVPNGNTEEEEELSTVTPASMDQTPAEQSSTTNPEKERQTIYEY